MKTTNMIHIATGQVCGGEPMTRPGRVLYTHAAPDSGLAMSSILSSFAGRYPTGDVMWQVRLRHIVTGMDEYNGILAAVTHIGEIVIINTVSGEVLAGEYRSEHNRRQGRPVNLKLGDISLAPLSLALRSYEYGWLDGWIGTLDGRVIEIALEVE